MQNITQTDITWLGYLSIHLGCQTNGIIRYTTTIPSHHLDLVVFHTGLLPLDPADWSTRTAWRYNLRGWTITSTFVAILLPESRDFSVDQSNTMQFLARFLLRVVVVVVFISRVTYSYSFLFICWLIKARLGTTEDWYHFYPWHPQFWSIQWNWVLREVPAKPRSWHLDTIGVWN